MRPNSSLIATVLVFIAGCGSGPQPALVPVRGQVFFGKSPASLAVVWFHPVEAVELGGRRPHGVVDTDGNFEMGTYKPNDGVPPGKYRVAIFWREPAKSGDDEGESLIPSRYMDAATSGLPMIDIQQEPVTLAPFYLSEN